MLFTKLKIKNLVINSYIIKIQDFCKPPYIFFEIERYRKCSFFDQKSMILGGYTRNKPIFEL